MFARDETDAISGMFSKSGKFTTEKHIIFQHKDEILLNRKKSFKFPSKRSEFQDQIKDQL